VVWYENSKKKRSRIFCGRFEGKDTHNNNKKKELNIFRKGHGKIWFYLIMQDRTINTKKTTERQKIHDSAFIVVIFNAYFFKI
jgi:hypothetical protein